MRIIRVFLLLSLLAPITARADSFGLTVRGTPKYSADAAHFDYVDVDAPKGGMLRQAAIGTFTTLNPFSINGPAAKGLDLVYDPLMRRAQDEPFTLYPVVAAHADIAPDGSAITFHIDPRARFSDGSPITADDVLFSYQTLREHGRPNMRSQYKLVINAEKPAPDTVRFSFGPGYTRETPLILALMPVLSKAWWSGKNFDATIMTPPVTSGPYRIASIDPQRQIVLQRDPQYWGRDIFSNRGLYNFDRVIYDYYRDDAIAFEAFKAGDLNFRREMNAGRWATAYDFPAMQSGKVVAEAIPYQRPEFARGLIFNTRRAPFDDPRVREALEYVGDFSWINRTLFDGKFRRVDSYFPNSSLAAAGAPDRAELAVLNPWRATLRPEIFQAAWRPPASDTNEQVRENLRHADAMLRDAGWVVVDGRRVRRDDPEKVFRFDIILDSVADEKIALAYANGLQRLGIEAGVRVLDAAQFSAHMRDYDYDMVLNYWSNTLSPGTEQMRYWSCAATKAPGGFNYAGVCSPAIDAIAGSLADAQTPEDFAARVHALDRVLTWGDYMVPLFYAGHDFLAHTVDLRHPAQPPLYGSVLESWWTLPAGAAENGR